MAGTDGVQEIPKIPELGINIKQHGPSFRYRIEALASQLKRVDGKPIQIVRHRFKLLAAAAESVDARKHAAPMLTGPCAGDPLLAI